MKLNTILTSFTALFAGSILLADNVWVTNQSSPVSSSEFTWNQTPSETDIWVFSSADTFANAVYNVNTALTFGGANIDTVNSNSLNLLSGGSLTLNSALTLAADTKLNLALSGGNMTVAGLTYQSPNLLSVSNGSSLKSNGNVTFNNASAVFSGAPSDSSLKTLDITGSLNLVPTAANDVQKVSITDGATAKISSSLTLGVNSKRDNSNTLFEVTGGSKVEVNSGATVWAMGENSKTGIAVKGNNSSLKISGNIQITSRRYGGLNERAYVEVSDGAYLKANVLEFWGRADHSNVSEFILKNGSTAEITGLNFRPNEATNNVAGTTRVIVSGSNNTLTVSGDLRITDDLALNSIATVEIDAGNNISVNNINAKQFTPASRDESTNAFVQGARFLFNADVNGDVSTIGILNSSANITVGSYLDLDFSNVVLGVGEYTTSYMFMGYNSISGFVNENVYLTFDGVNFNTLDSEGKFANEKFSFELLNEAGQLGYTLTYVPEPSTYAAIFGALALAFAAYRRRKN